MGNKIHLVKWGMDSKAKNLGQFGLRRLETPNKALLSKWLWRNVVKVACGRIS